MDADISKPGSDRNVCELLIKRNYPIIPAAGDHCGSERGLWLGGHAPWEHACVQERENQLPEESVCICTHAVVHPSASRSWALVSLYC